MPDNINHPAHYTSGPKCSCGKTIECIDITETLGFCRGNAVKYIWRAGRKGNELEDLRKARWYIDREIARLESKTDKPKPYCPKGWKRNGLGALTWHWTTFGCRFLSIGKLVAVSDKPLFYVYGPGNVVHGEVFDSEESAVRFAHDRFNLGPYQEQDDK